MRKRLIGKAFAVAMSGAMVLTATPVTANIFNVAHIVKAAEQSDDYVYCYAGLTWSEYWANEAVYNAGKNSSSTVTDSNGEFDKGGYDAVSRATTNHGLHRGNFQCTTVIHTKEGKDFHMAYWADQSHIVLTDGSTVKFEKGTITDANNNTYTMPTNKAAGDVGYSVLGLKYVPVAVKASDYEAFKAKYAVVENGGSLAGGYGEGTLSSYTAVANVTKNTNGLKTATKNSDGSFSFSARKTGTDSGLKDSAIKKVDTKNLVITVREGDDVGSYGEFLRVDLTGSAYSDLGANMQAVTWTYYGYDDTYSKPVSTYGTKFASDNWMHKSMGIQLGLTDSDRCQLPAGYDGTGYWTIKISALGYEDFSFNVQVKGQNIANATEATAEDKANLQKVIDQAKAMKNDKASYADGQEKAWTDLDTELSEAEDALKAEKLYTGTVKECISHLTAAMNALKKKDTTSAPTTTTTAPTTTTTKTKTTTVKAPAKTTVKLSKAKKTSLKVTWKKVSGAAAYQIQYSTSKNFKKAKTIKVSAKSASKVLTKLKKNKKYYVRVRSYKVTKVNNKSKNVYSAWSASKALKTKKK